MNLGSQAQAQGTQGHATSGQTRRRNPVCQPPKKRRERRLKHGLDNQNPSCRLGRIPPDHLQVQTKEKSDAKRCGVIDQGGQITEGKNPVTDDQTHIQNRR